MPRTVNDITPLVDLTRELGPGPQRWRRPVYQNLMPPCNQACPAGEDIQGWLALAQAGNDRQAWELLVRDNPFPAVHGRVCYHPCEDACNRVELDSTVGIHAVERFLGDRALEAGWEIPVTAPASGCRVLVIGAGPSGLAAAYHLARLGHAVEICEAGPLPGGMLHFGIPAYRLPRPLLLQEIARIEAMGVHIQLNHKVEDILAEKRAGNFDAVFIAIGAEVGRKLEVPARDAAQVLQAVTLLRQAAEGSHSAPRLGRRVVIYGGGNTALDAARVARRLGASEPLVIYRRDREHMPAHAFELEEAMAEGVQVRWLSTIKAIAGEQLTVETMRLDAQGRPQPTGEFETLEADSVILALGQETDSGFLRRVPGIEFGPAGVVQVTSGMMTGHAGIFAGGDMSAADGVGRDRTVTTAVGHGKRAARAIDAWLRDRATLSRNKPAVVSFAMLHLPIYTDALPAQQPQRPVAERITGFEEVVAGLSQAEAHHEAQRCLSCGNCFECDNCMAACPQHAITKLGQGWGYQFDLGRCTGCAECVEQCPCAAMTMIPEAV